MGLAAFRTAVEPSRTGQGEALHLNYLDFPFSQMIDDEIREVAPGLYLGVAYAKTNPFTNTYEPAFFFGLQEPKEGVTQPTPPDADGFDVGAPPKIDPKDLLDFFPKPKPANEPIKSNWSGNIQFDPKYRHFPKSVEELQQIVIDAASRGEKVKVVGAGHSWSDIATTKEHLVTLDPLVKELEKANQLLKIDRAKNEVTVNAGMRLEDLNKKLWEQGLAVSNLGMITKQSIAGVMSTGTHGTGTEFGCIATQVQSMRLLTADGRILDLRRDAKTQEERELFQAAAVGLGGLGIIVDVTLKVEPAYYLQKVRRIVDIDEKDAQGKDAVDHMAELAAKSRNAQFAFIPGADVLIIEEMNKTDGKDLTDLSTFWKTMWSGTKMITELGNRYPDLIPWFNRAIDHMKNQTMIERGKSYEMLSMDANDLPKHRELEVGIPAEDAAEALRELRKIADLYRVNMTDGVRFTKADDFYMSPAYGRDTAYIAAYSGYTEDADKFLAEAERMLVTKFKGRPHLGKETFLSPEEIRSVFPDWQKYEAVRAKLDPNGMFENDFIERTFVQGT
jgi:L-gulonolactone oxidase